MNLLHVLKAPLLATLAVFAVSVLVIDREMGLLVNAAPEAARLAIMVWAGWLVVRQPPGSVWNAATSALLIVLVDPLLLRGGMLFLGTAGDARGQALTGFVVLVMLTAPVAMLFGAFGGLLGQVRSESRARRAAAEAEAT
jgi:hypothetical protein